MDGREKRKMRKLKNIKILPEKFEKCRMYGGNGGIRISTKNKFENQFKGY